MTVDGLMRLLLRYDGDEVVRLKMSDICFDDEGYDLRDMEGNVDLVKVDDGKIVLVSEDAEWM